PDDWAIDWRLFFDFDNNAPKLGSKRIQPAYKPDTSVVNPLAHLPASVAVDPPSLPERNLLRGWRMQLPSGQAIARAMGLDPIKDNDLKVGKATEADTKKNKKLVDISPRFADNAPLWYYVLAEAQQQFKDDETPIHLGDVGGRIVGEVIVGLMLQDSHSYLRVNPKFKPLEKLLSPKKQFNMADLLKTAKKTSGAKSIAAD